MKNLRLLFIFMAAVMFTVSCSDTKQAELDDLAAKKATFYGNEYWNSLDLCNVQSHELIGGQDILMGTVQVGNTADSLYVKYQADEGYVIAETHLFVGDVMGTEFPKGKKDNPKIGQFPYASEVSSTMVIYSIALSDIEGDCFDVAAHAVVQCADGGCEETAWGAGKIADEVVFAVKSLVYNRPENLWFVGLSEGVKFAEECVLFPNIGYVTLDLDNFTPATYNILEETYGEILFATVDVDIVNDSLVFMFNNESELELSHSYIFVGSLIKLYETIGGTWNCPQYLNYPRVNGESIIKIALSDLPSGTTEEAFELNSTRWGFYMNYCKKDC